jgi:hypothetical protein
VRRIDGVSGTISTIAGGGSGGLDGPATDAALGPIGSLAVDARANVYLTEFVAAANTYRLLRVDAESGVITLVREDAFGSIAVRREHVFFSEQVPGIYMPSNRVFRLDLRTGAVVTVAGGGTRTGNGPATRLSLNTGSIAVNRAGDLFGVADWRVWKIAAGTEVLRTVAGKADGSSWLPDGSGPFIPGFVAAGSASVFVTTFEQSPGGVYSNGVLRIDPGSPGRLKRVAGLPYDVSYSGDGGPATEAGLAADGPIAADPDDNLYIFDNYRRIRVVKRPR